MSFGWSDFHLCDPEDPIVGPFLGGAAMTSLSESVGPAWQYFGPGFNPIIVWKDIPPIKQLLHSLAFAVCHLAKQLHLYIHKQLVV